jgi:hypothetical protein
MTRTSQILWPVVALVASIAAVFALTWLFSDPRPQEEDQSGQLPTVQPSPAPSETPLEGGMVIEVRGVQRPGFDPAPPVEGTPVVANLLVYKDDRLCLDPAFRNGWKPASDEGSWYDYQGSWCRPLAHGAKLDLVFERK